MCITPDTIANKFIGEGETAAAIIFEMAKLQGRCIIFIDECDQLLRNRSAKGAENTASLTSALMIQMEELKRRDNVLVVLATNLPWALDPAVMSRISSSTYVGLPSKWYF